ncbi:MAG: NYN domain-containing protein [Victivallales bacterium]|nr:NYN domain-containing protein [Victivallales bacterium]
MDKVGVYIDADNISVAYADEIMKKAAELGDIVICRAYGNLSAFSGDKSWKEGMKKFAIQAFPQVSICENKKNSADFALMLDALEAALTNTVSVICIVSSDSDFLPLVQRLRPRISVYGFGIEKTLMSYRMAFMKFFVLDECKSLENEINAHSSEILDSTSVSVLQQVNHIMEQSLQLTPRQALLIAYEIARANNAIGDNFCTKTAWGTKLKQLAVFLPSEYQSKDKLLSKLLKISDNQTLFMKKENVAEDSITLSLLGISCLKNEKAVVDAVMRMVS